MAERSGISLKAHAAAKLDCDTNDGVGGLVLAGHTDTVPFDEALWSSDRFTVKGHQDRFSGLGSCDMKGIFSVALEAAATFAKQEPCAALTIVATSDQEPSMVGSRYLVECGKPKADYAIIGEPTAMQPIFVHKGISMVKIQLPKAYPPIPPFQSGPTGELLDALIGLSGNQPVTVAFCTEAHFMQALGMENVVRWPRSVDQAHQPKDTLRRVIQKFCLV